MDEEQKNVIICNTDEEQKNVIIMNTEADKKIEKNLNSYVYIL